MRFETEESGCLEFVISMRLITIIFIGITFVVFAACGQQQNHLSADYMKKLEDFKNKEKFTKDSASYSGVENQVLRSVLTEKMNSAADDFIVLSKNNNVTDNDYQDKIKVGLDRFSDVYLDLDTEERERICLYFEELMDIVELQSSGGHLNNFMYGFNPAQKTVNQ